MNLQSICDLVPVHFPIPRSCFPPQVCTTQALTAEQADLNSTWFNHLLCLGASCIVNRYHNKPPILWWELRLSITIWMVSALRMQPSIMKSAKRQPLSHRIFSGCDLLHRESQAQLSYGSLPDLRAVLWSCCFPGDVPGRDVLQRQLPKLLKSNYRPILLGGAMIALEYRGRSSMSARWHIDLFAVLKPFHAQGLYLDSGIRPRRGSTA